MLKNRLIWTETNPDIHRFIRFSWLFVFFVTSLFFVGVIFLFTYMTVAERCASLESNVGMNQSLPSLHWMRIGTSSNHLVKF